MTFASTARTETTGAKTGRRILVVDYNKDFVATIRVLLELNGHYVEVAFDGHAGLEAAIRTEPDVVVLEVGLPKLNGYEVCHRIREQRLARQPIIIARRAGRSLSTVSWGSTQGSTRTWSSRSSTKSSRHCWSQLGFDHKQFERTAGVACLCRSSRDSAWSVRSIAYAAASGKKNRKVAPPSTLFSA